ncbi:hypothetical protein [Nonomuraea dietziae]|uniref:hypothetical protein n=1 Tax=Nonomuraea dietziae TaxID=65515 RepID=UPI0031DEE4B9
MLLSESGGQVVTARLERTAAFARARVVLEPGEELDDAVDAVFGVRWVEGETHGFARQPRVPLGRRGAYRARSEAQAEAAKLRAEVERLRGQVDRWREESGKWRRSTVELRREVGTLRRQLAAAGRVQQGLRAALTASVKRALKRKV